MTKNYISFEKGTLPIILSAPHGGDKTPNTIKNRKSGVFEKDDYTIELTKEIQKEFLKQTRKKAFAIISKISRKKIDLNRSEDEAYEDKKAKKIYKEFHSKIKLARKCVKKDFKKGLYFDIHGQSHPKGFVEFGYLLDNNTLKTSSLKKYQNSSSIKKLSLCSTFSFKKQIKGKYALGSLMDKNGFRSIPSKKIPYAKDGNYFEGAFNTLKYGYHTNDEVFAIQVEFPYKNCRDTKTNRKKCAKAFVKAVIKFSKVHLNQELNY